LGLKLKEILEEFFNICCQETNPLQTAINMKATVCVQFSEAYSEVFPSTTVDIGESSSVNNGAMSSQAIIQAEIAKRIQAENLLEQSRIRQAEVDHEGSDIEEQLPFSSGLNDKTGKDSDDDPNKNAEDSGEGTSGKENSVKKNDRGGHGGRGNRGKRGGNGGRGDGGIKSFFKPV